MRSSTGIPQNLRSLIEQAIQPRVRCEEQTTTTVTAPAAQTMEDGEIRIVTATDEAKVYFRAGRKRFEITVTEVT